MRRPALLGLALAAVLAAPPAVSPLAAQSVTIVVDGIPREVPVLERQGRRFVALARVAELLGGRIAESGFERAVLEVDDARLVVHRRIPFVQHEERWYQLTEPAQKDATGFWIPASGVLHLFPELWPGRFAPSPREPGENRRPAAPEQREQPRPGEIESGMIGREAAPAPGRDDLEAIDVWSRPGRTRLGFRLRRTPGVTVDATLPGALELHLGGVELPAAAAAGLRGVGLVDSVSTVTVEDGTALTVWLDDEALVWSVAPLRRPEGVEIVLLTAPPDEAAMLAEQMGPRPGARDPGGAGRRSVASGSGEASPTPAASEPGPEPRRRPESPPEPSPRGEDAWRVVVDAGHGGHDPGATGPGGTREKEFTLDLALALEEALESSGAVEVVLTRDDDTFVPLGERTRLANEWGADLFVSIHANAAENPSAGGFETFFLSAAKTEEARRVARMENAAIRYENPSIDPESLDDLNFILWDLAQNEYLRESSVLAETVQGELDRRLSLKSRGVKQAPFFVLNGAFMPAILFETAFITNPREEALLNDPAFRSRMVDGLARSIREFLERHRRKTLVPSAAR